MALGLRRQEQTDNPGWLVVQGMGRLRGAGERTAACELWETLEP